MYLLVCSLVPGNLAIAALSIDEPRMGHLAALRHGGAPLQQIRVTVTAPLLLRVRCESQRDQIKIADNQVAGMANYEICCSCFIQLRRSSDGRSPASVRIGVESLGRQLMFQAV